MQEMLEKLCSAYGVAGAEEDICKVAGEILAPLGRVETTPLNSVICYLPTKNESLPKVMLTAHIDQVGLMVTQITEKGFLKVASCGGPDRRSMWGARVAVLTEAGPIDGVITAVPPHLSSGKSIPSKIEELAVDIGMDKETAQKKVALGDPVALKGGIKPLLGDRVAGVALDDRAGCAAVIKAAELLKDCDNAQIIVALVSQEETGSAGAATAANIIKPDFCFAVDVSMALTPDSTPESCGEIGKGPMIGISPVLDRKLFNTMKAVAEENKMPYQIEVMSGRTGTDADHIAVSQAGVATALLSIPLRFMHTQNEVVSIGDVMEVARLIAKTVGGAL